MACPFCGADVQVRVERAQLASSSNVASRRITNRRSVGGPVTIETLTAEEVQKLADDEVNVVFESARQEALRRHRSAPVEAEPAKTAWDVTYGAGAFFATLREILRAPRRFFAELEAGSPVPAVLFAALVLTPGAVAHVLTLDFWLGRYGLASLVPVHELALGVAMLLPLTVLYLVATYHMGATLLCQRRLRIYGVVRATCFGLAPLLLAVVPGVGLAIGALWALVLHYFALRRHLGLAAWQASVALLVPLAPVAAIVATS